MPALSQALLGEPLKIPDIPTLWCGTESARKEVFATLQNRVVRKAFDSQPLFSRHSSAKLGAELSAAERASLIEEMQARGGTFVAQDIMPLGLTPSLGARGLMGQPYMLRVYAAWTPSGYIVMPGGLARIAPEEGPREVTMQSGAQSKDAWVLSGRPRLIRSRCCRHQTARSRFAAPAMNRQAAPWTICSGSAAMPSARKTSRVSCAPSCCGWATIPAWKARPLPPFWRAAFWCLWRKPALPPRMPQHWAMKRALPASFTR